MQLLGEYFVTKMEVGSLGTTDILESARFLILNFGEFWRGLS
ncbi:hypothetical protein Gohar_024607 [Gossypium harknessii]|uniref:Uncharacterized protein n=1 Tax=Gossypium harknessii TaxID=34285 RepID=A0A7J9HGF6_9ROSI|nr:hypothetical protein [Gossypium harknessii]